VPRKSKDEQAKFLVMVTKNGTIKKTALDEFENVRKSGIIAIKLDKGDTLKKVVKTSGEDDIILTTKQGIAIRFKEKDIRAMGRGAAGVRGIRLKKGDEVVGVDVIAKTENKEKRYLLVVMENGYGKRTDIASTKFKQGAAAESRQLRLLQKQEALLWHLCWSCQLTRKI
jgi:DNA gyrase subunit A